MAIEPSEQFSSIVDSNYSKCPGCGKNHVSDSSPVTSVDNKTKICGNCSVSELARSAIKDSDPSSMLNTKGSVTNLIDSYNTAKKVEQEKTSSEAESTLYENRIKTAHVPIPESKTIGKWKVSYGRHPQSGQLNATAESPSGSQYGFTLESDGQIRADSTDLPKGVHNHVTKTLTNLHKTHIEGKP